MESLLQPFRRRRFPVDPFIMVMAATHPNRLFTAVDAQLQQGADDIIRYPIVYLMPQTHAPHVFFEDAIGAASIFERVEVLVNGQEVREEKMGAYSYLYAAMNRLLMTKGRRIKKYGRDIARISVGAEHDTSGTFPQVLLEAMAPLQSEGQKTAPDILHRFGFDGIWPFDSQSNILWALTGVEATNGYLPPEMDLTVRLYKRSDRCALLQRASQTDALVYSANAAQIANTEKVTFDIKDLIIQYEVLTTDAKTMANMKSKTTYFVDVPRVSIDQVDAGKMFSTNLVDLPRAAKFVALAWVYEDEVFHKAASNKPLSARYFFPPNAENVTVGFEGEPGLLFPLGFEHLGTEKAQNSITSREYYRQMVHRGLYSRAYEKMFPVHPDRSYDQILLFDLTAHKLHDGAKLNVHVKYAAARSLPGYYLAAVAVQQMEYTYHHDRELTCKLVV